MKRSFQQRNQAGFTLVQAIFVLVVLAFLGVAMLRLSGVQSYTSLFALQGARAYQAARSGLEWGAARAAAGSSCNGSFDVDGFAVTVTCSSSAYAEGSMTTTVYKLNATAEFGSYDSPDYVSRRVEMKVGF
jgi:MSHA biogenesis protein MshP